MASTRIASRTPKSQRSRRSRSTAQRCGRRCQRTAARGITAIKCGACGGARRGRKAALLTIDPAKRLANALGLERLGNEPRRVRALEGDGELWAMMLDAKRTFDDLVETYASDERTRDAVLSNRIYQELSSAVSGSQEYMAMEKLYELHMAGEFDLL